MDPKEKLIITKLLSIAEKQQKILTKLAQAQEDVEGNKSYLKSAWQTAGLNTGIPIGTPQVTYTPGGPAESGAMMEGNYSVTGEIPVDKRVKFLATFTTQIKSQKPELDGKVNTIFKDPQTKTV